MEEKDYEEFYSPEWINVDMTEYYNMQENLEYYKTFVKKIVEEIGSEEQDSKKIEFIKDYIGELKEVLH